MSFDLDTYRSLSAKLVMDDIDFSSFREQPLSPDAFDASATYTSRATRCATCGTSWSPGRQRIPISPSFLTVWNVEEYWRGDAIAEVLDAHNESASTAGAG
ncbi:MAG TPA: hypothetical protein VGI44_18035 [Acidimicrobiales bacterium]